MPNFRDDILEAAGDETILAIVIGDYGWSNYNPGTVDAWDKIQKISGKVIPWDDAVPLLDYTYDNRYGAPKCHCITAWTETRVLFVSQYDVETSVESVPRNPCNHKPTMPGG